MSLRPSYLVNFIFKKYARRVSQAVITSTNRLEVSKTINPVLFKINKIIILTSDTKEKRN